MSKLIRRGPSVRQVTRPGPGTPVAVVGLARSGVAAAEWLLRLGCEVRVTEASRSPEIEQAAKALRAAGARVELGGHSEQPIRGARLVVVSPGVPSSAPPVRWAQAAGIPVVGELELGAWYCPARTAAVTGTNGKSTVVTMIGQILKQSRREASVCGNIGRPLCGELGRLSPLATAVLEVSSFQLEPSLSFHSEVACLLNVTGNHLDRHGSFENYREAKARLFDHQRRDGWAVLNADDAGSAGMERRVRGRLALFSRTKKVAGAFIEKGELRLDLPGLSVSLCRREELSYRGPHHEENGLAAACVAALLGVSPEHISSVLRTFRGLPYRQELVATIRGVSFINDSKSTTVASSIRAIESAPGQVILIAGGRDKGSDFRLIRPLAGKIKAAVLIGEDGPKIADALEGATTLFRAKDLREAVATAFGMAKERECVLLSPMCASFDMFRNYEERGERFTQAVRDLAGEKAA